MTPQDDPKPRGTPPSNGFFRQGGVWVLVQNGLTLSLVLAGPLGQGQGRAWPDALRMLAIPCLGLSAGLGFAGLLALGRQLSPYPRSVRPTHLICSGIYSRVRHPLYGSLMTFGFGWAVAWSSAPAVLLAVLQVLVLLGKSSVEEAWLRQRFPDYPAYAARVRRFIPWVW